jgi:hypothetical protein
MVLATNFQKQNSQKVNNYWHIINLDCHQRQKLFIPKSKYTAEVWTSVQQIEAKNGAISLCCTSIWVPDHSTKD